MQAPAVREGGTLTLSPTSHSTQEECGGSAPVPLASLADFVPGFSSQTLGLSNPVLDVGGSGKANQDTRALVSKPKFWGKSWHADAELDNTALYRWEG